MDMKTPCMTYSESGQPTGVGPCAGMAALDKENVVMRRQMERLIDERDALRTALTASGIPAQARLDDKGPPLRITVERAREIMGMVEHG